MHQEQKQNQNQNAERVPQGQSRMDQWSRQTTCLIPWVLKYRESPPPAVHTIVIWIDLSSVCIVIATVVDIDDVWYEAAFGLEDTTHNLPYRFRYDHQLAVEVGLISSYVMSISWKESPENWECCFCMFICGSVITSSPQGCVSLLYLPPNWTFVSSAFLHIAHFIIACLSHNIKERLHHKSLLTHHWLLSFIVQSSIFHPWFYLQSSPYTSNL